MMMVNVPRMEVSLRINLENGILDAPGRLSVDRAVQSRSQRKTVALREPLLWSFVLDFVCESLRFRFA